MNTFDPPKIDITGLRPIRLSSYQSERFIADLAFEGGFVMHGLLTRESEYRPFEECNKLLDELVNFVPEDDFEERQRIMSLRIEEDHTDEDVERLYEFFEEKIKEDSMIAQLCYSVYVRSSIAENGLGLKAGANLDGRSVAYSLVAMLLDRGELIANSLPVRVIEKDKLSDGTFTEFIYGYTDLNELTPDDLYFKCGLDACIGGRMVVRDLADLQIMDYICGNVDRHAYNLLYQFETAEEDDRDVVYLAAIRGIDNDCSFGLLPLNDGAGMLAGLSGLKVVSSRMAKALSNLTVEKLCGALAETKLSEEEIAMAAMRLLDVKERVFDPKSHEGEEIYILSDDMWKDIKYEKLFDSDADGNLKNNIFSIVATIFLSEEIEARREDAEIEKAVN